ncbi:MAG: orotidine-5'-phosphate decarboxylase [Bacteroidetes bacterium]|nr:orotidine-5'-phosphate decarboxylase [Bacteroidota bacterium]
MTYNQLVKQIGLKRSFLCAGLDGDRAQMPPHLRKDPNALFAFNRELIDATAEYVVAYKPNTAFYEVEGSSGWRQLSQTVAYIKENYPEILIIADAKRGDIGHTAQRYARAFFEELNVDAVTLSPYMGADSLTPFLGYKEKWAIVLALTSNDSASDFEMQSLANGQPLFEVVIQKSALLGTKEQLMFVAGATRPQALARFRQLIPDHFLLVPGVGAQGGNLEEVALYGMNPSCGLLVNVSRGMSAFRAKEIAQKMDLLLPNTLVC